MGVFKGRNSSLPDSRSRSQYTWILFGAASTCGRWIDAKQVIAKSTGNTDILDDLFMLAEECECVCVSSSLSLMDVCMWHESPSVWSSVPSAHTSLKITGIPQKLWDIESHTF